MSKKVILAVVLALGVVTLVASPAMARGFYVGGSIGQTSSDIDGLGTIDSSLGGSVSETDTGYKVFGGYNVIKRGQLRFEAERYAMEDLDVDLYSTGFSYRF